MNRMAIFFSMLLVGALVFAEDESAADDAAFGRYRTILTRMPFGPNPPGFSEDGDAPEEGANGGGADPAIVQTPEEVQNLQQELAKLIKVKCINVAPGGEVKVGFDDLESKGVFYLSVGSERKGWTVVDADYDKEWAQIARDGVMVTMRLDEGMIDTPVDSKGASWVFTNASPGFASSPAPRPAASLPAARAGGAASRLGIGAGGTLSERLRMRTAQQREAKERREAEIRQQEEERQAQEAERQAKEEEEAKAHAEERAQVRDQLKELSETLKKVREERARADEEQDGEEAESEE